MDDISSAVSKLLQDDKAMSYLQELLGASGASGANGASNSDGEGLSAKNLDTPRSGGLDIGAISSITKLFSSSDNETERLIEALLPFLSDKRRKKASDAKKILKIIAVLPALKSSGLLEGLLGSD